MTLSFIASVTPASFTAVDGITHETNNELIVVDSTSSTLRRYNLNTTTQVGSNVTLTSIPAGVCLVDSASALSVMRNTASFDLVEIASGYKQNYTVSGGSSLNTTKTNQIAGDPSTKIAMAISGGNSTLFKFNANTYTTSTVVLPKANENTNTFASIILKESGKWLVGGNGGDIFEIDSNGNVLSRFSLGLPNTFARSGILNTPGSIRTMSYDNGLLLVVTFGGHLFLIDWGSKTVIKEQVLGTASTSIFLSPSVSGECIFGSQTANVTGATVIYELDYTVKPFTVRDILFNDSTAGIVAAGVNGLNGRGWTLQASPTNKIRFITMTPPRVTTTRTFTVNPGGNHLKVRLSLYDNSGVEKKPYLDTIMQSPCTYRVPTGKNILEYIEYGEGEDAAFDVSTYNT